MEFEKKLAELEALADKLESGSVGLEEGIGLYEKSLQLTGECLRDLNEFKGKVQVIRKEMDELTEKAFTEDL